MSNIYLTGTLHPSPALGRFIPNYLDTLLGQGHEIITSNKRGVDALILAHCHTHNLPLTVWAFLNPFTGGNKVTSTAGNIRVNHLYTPTWLRFRHLAGEAQAMVFFHSSRTRGNCTSIPTLEAFPAACQRYGIPHEQYIVQAQSDVWVNQGALVRAPQVGTSHLYIYARLVYGLNGERHMVAHYRLETWRAIQGVIQPGLGKRELVIPHANTTQAATELALSHALQELRQPTPPTRLVIHHWLKRPLAADVRGFPFVEWQIEDKPALLEKIGAPVKVQQELWQHKRVVASARGLYQ